MSHFTSEVPEVLIKPGKMINISSSKMKALFATLVLILYVYLLLFVKTIYLKNKRLDKIMEMALEAEKEMLNVHRIDKKLAKQMANMDQMYEDY